jgi:membrane protein implicated in regulation of membrane protease activity
MAKISAWLIAHLELLLAGMSLPVVGLIHLLVSVRFEDPWKITAAAALAVGVLHGFLGWFVRSRQRSVRLQLLRQAGAILQKKSPLAAGQHAGQAHLSEYDVRLASAQLVAVVREPLIMKVVPFPAHTERDLSHGRPA